MANKPITREEILLNAVATGETANLEPITREEMFLAKLGGADVNTPPPITRKEQFLQKAIESGGSGGVSDDRAVLVKLVDRTITEFEVPKEVASIGSSAFNACGLLKTIKFHDGVTVIKSYAFNACSNLKLEEIPAGVTEIQASAFVLCRSITNITFKGTPSKIDAEAFRNCVNLVTFNVPWAEGEVANAPWGATAATINYNYTGG